MTKSYIYECKTYAVNTAKWKAAQEWCADRKIEFKIITEKELGIRYDRELVGKKKTLLVIQVPLLKFKQILMRKSGKPVPLNQREYQKPLSRVERLKERLEEENTTDVEDIMMTIMDIFNDTVTPVPDVGNFYTFIYQPKTPNIHMINNL